MSGPGSPQSVEALARALTADPPRPVAPEALAAADREELAGALRRAVSDLPSVEQRHRLAAAFTALSLARESASAAAVPSVATPSRRSSMLRSLTPARIAAVAGTAVVSVVVGIGLGGLLEDQASTASESTSAAPDPVREPVPLLEPLAVGDAAPAVELIDGLLPPDPGEEAAALEAALADASPEERAAIELEGTADDETAGGAGRAADAPSSMGRAAGYVDGAALFPSDEPGGPPDDADDTGGTDEAGSGSGSGGLEESEPGGTTGDDPVLVDVCASEDPPRGCEGVGGTVWLAIGEAFAFNIDPIVAAQYAPACLVDGDLPAGQFVIELHTNNPASFTARYRVAGSDDGFVEVAGVTPEVWREAMEDGSVVQAITCLVGDRPAGEPARLELEVTGEGEADTGSATWRGVVPLPPPPEVASARPGRPAVTVQPVSAGSFRVLVPVGREEEAEVSLYMPDEDEDDPRCATAPAEDLTPGIAAVRVRRPGSITLSDWTTFSYEVVAPRPGAGLVCVEWLDGFDPPGVLERVGVPVVASGAPRAQVLVAGYRAAAGHAQPERIDATAFEGREACGTAPPYLGDRLGESPDLDDPRVVCEMASPPEYAAVRIHSDFGEEEVDQPVAMPVPSECPGGAATCTTWYSAHVRSPDGSFPGALVLGIRLVDSGRPSDASAGTEVPELLDEVPIDGPRLDWERVRVEADPSDPSGAAVVEWGSDVPATVTTTAVPRTDAASCPRRSAGPSSRADHGRVVIDGLCPGVSYLVGFRLSNDAGTTVYDVSGSVPSGYGIHRVSRSATHTTELLTAEYDYVLRFRETSRGEVVNEGVVPTYMALTFARHMPDDTRTHRYSFSQYYDGRARFELVCANPGDFDRAEAGIRASLAGGRFYLSDSAFTFEVYEPTRYGLLDTGRGRQCPSVAMQANQVVSGMDCGARVPALEPVPGTDQLERMRDGEPAVFKAVVPVCGSSVRQFEVTLTVNLREVRSLRGAPG